VRKKARSNSPDLPPWAK